RSPPSSHCPCATLFRSRRAAALLRLQRRLVPRAVGRFFDGLGLLGLGALTLQGEVADRLAQLLLEPVERLPVARLAGDDAGDVRDRKSTRLNSSHVKTS